MTTTIYNNDGKPVAQSHNLRAMLRGASLYGGVRSLRVIPVKMGVPVGAPVEIDGGAEVTAFYANGYIGKTLFVSHSHAVEWAFERSELSGRVSFFAGCDVVAPFAPLDEFTRAYLVAALWSSTDSSGEPLDSNYDLDDIAQAWRAQAIADCRAFQRANRSDLTAAYAMYRKSEWTPQAQAGHDFWLTRNGHGAGFWDRGLGQLGETLTAAAKACGTVDIDECNMQQQHEESDDVPGPKEHDTYRTECGRGRTTYRAEWDEKQPWTTYIDGTAGRHFADLTQAAQHFASRGMKLKI